MDDDTKFFIAMTTLVLLTGSIFAYAIKSDRDQVREMAEKGYVWVPRTEGHYEKAK